MNFVETKIEEVYNVALMLGLSNANDFEKEIFKDALKSIALVAVDDSRQRVSQLMHEISMSYNLKS